MHTERSTYQSLIPRAPVMERRVDWSMAQVVDRQIDNLALGALHPEVDRAMYSRGVSDQVRRRVLAGQAAHRSRMWRELS